MDAPQMPRHGGRHRGRPIPPVVGYLVIEAAAYLLAWERRADGWWGQIAWVETTGTTDGQLRGQSIWASARQLQPVPGQSYDQVPRRTRRADPRPHDPTDPRDPGKMSRWEARALHERRNLPPREDPDF